MNIPPEVKIDSRVWAIKGQKDQAHKLMSLPINSTGTITKTSKNSTGSILYHVKWDNKEESIHYHSQLLGIGSSQSLDELKSSLQLSGPVNVTLGPSGRFRRAALFDTSQGEKVQIKLSDLDSLFWKEVLEPMLEKAGIKVVVSKLPGKK